MKLEKMKKTAGILYTITNIIRILVIIAFVVVAVAAGVIFFIPGTVIPEGIITTSVSLGDVTVHLAEGAAVGTMDKSRFSIILAFAAVILLLTLYGLRMVKQVLKPMKEGRPFDESIADSLRRLGHVVLASGIVSCVLAYLSQAAMLGVIDYKELFNPALVTGVDIRSSFSFDFIIVALALYLMSYVFRYGSELQRESDETL
ncbi:MAG: DUF2975 domain-containing protein [Solobacterium sp.]|nr:DUF2975 domain-containing protein [Solobacterium sp.]